MNIYSIDFSISTSSLDIFLSGCSGEHCENCHNPELWDFTLGSEYNQEYADKIISQINDFDLLIENVFIMGGEPLQSPTESLRHLLRTIKVKTNKATWLFTRFELEDIPSNILYYCDYVKCGRFIPNSKSVEYFGVKLASDNQIIYKQGVDF